MMKRNNNPIHWLPGVILTAFLLTSCSSIQTLFSPNQPEATALPIVEGIALVTAEGRVVPEKFTTLSFPISGRLEVLFGEEGGMVEKMRSWPAWATANRPRRRWQQPMSRWSSAQPR
jgi:multidrug efflux pump subunit AcrA (membrane-fusion protein)